jgi:hypothetical protein
MGLGLKVFLVEATLRESKEFLFSFLPACVWRGWHPTGIVSLDARLYVLIEFFMVGFFEWQ